jgi:hypothetical protein
MKSILTLCLLIAFGQCTSQITAAEYFIDTDPGIENGESISVDSDFTVNENFNFSTSGIEQGFHTLYVRVKDAMGAWSLYDKQSFHVSPQMVDYAISDAEYFIDSDPGIGNGNPVSIADDFMVSESISLSTAGLEEGFHQLYVRVKDTDGNWSIYDEQSFQVTSVEIPAEITDAEYFIDADPGVGNGFQVTVSDGFEVAEEFQLGTEGLESGFHTLYVRVKDSNEGWTLYDKQNFRIQDSGPITTAEYFVDTDPGLGNGEEILIQPGHNVYEEPQLSTVGLAPGLHNLYVRVMDSDNVWSPADTAEFTIVIVDGLSELTTSAFVIYPNPTTERINLNTDEHIQQLSIYDDKGGLVKSQTGNRYQIDVSELPAGNYLLEVVSAEVRHHFRFIKDR